MKTTILFLLLIFFSSIAFFACKKNKDEQQPAGNVTGSNLVKNNSFEEYSMCPDNETQIERSIGWFKSSGDADYYNSCSPNKAWSVPPSKIYQLAATGNAFAGLITYVEGTGSEEIIHTVLSSPLTIGTKYYVSFKVNCAAADYIANIAVNKLGAKFTTGSIPLINNFAQVFTNTVIQDTLNWTSISGSFIADSAYTTMFLGIFFDEASIDTVKLAPPYVLDMAYYFIDDVCVSTDSGACN